MSADTSNTAGDEWMSKAESIAGAAVTSTTPEPDPTYLDQLSYVIEVLDERAPCDTDIEIALSAADWWLRLRDAIHSLDTIARARALVSSGPAPAPTEPKPIELVEDLHRAIYGDTWARPDTPKAVWDELLAKVEALRDGRCWKCMEDVAAAPPGGPCSHPNAAFTIGGPEDSDGYVWCPDCRTNLSGDADDTPESADPTPEPE